VGTAAGLFVLPSVGGGVGGPGGGATEFGPARALTRRVTLLRKTRGAGGSGEEGGEAATDRDRDTPAKEGGKSPRGSGKDGINAGKDRKKKRDKGEKEAASSTPKKSKK